MEVARTRCLPWVALIVFCLLGCSRRPSNVSDVTGTVTLAGQPLSDAAVIFTPTGNGTSSSARTDSAGKYELIYSKDVKGVVKGAVQGEHTVTITTHQPANPDGDPPSPEIPEKVPYKYREGDASLKATVNPGKNEVNFELESGPVTPPPTKGAKKGRKSADVCY
jgi:hypothetical protein